MCKKIYVADDESNIRIALKTFLESDGYKVSDFETGDKLYEYFIREPADLVILDIMMPGSSGFDICTKIRSISNVPIIMLTARDSDLDCATGLSLGSDDYFTKPFSAMSLVMRVKAIFRRIEFDKQDAGISEKNDGLTFSDITIVPRSKTAFIGTEPLDLTPNEFKVLTYLIEHRDKAVSREELLSKIWGFETEVETRAADDTIHRLRKKICPSRLRIDTVWGFGFRIKEREQPSE